MKYTVTLTKTIYVQVTAENMYDMMEQLENHDYCKEQGYIIKTAHLQEEEEEITDNRCMVCKNEADGFCAKGGCL